MDSNDEWPVLSNVGKAEVHHLLLCLSNLIAIIVPKSFTQCSMLTLQGGVRQLKLDPNKSYRHIPVQIVLLGDVQSISWNISFSATIHLDILRQGMTLKS